AFSTAPIRPLALTGVAGLVVGFGTRMGGGCTSGHGVCGMSRFSARSTVATLTFMAVGVVTVFATRLALGV
ncbi:MAG: YeeE/YedE thiosulfate transporter family protein, partial [Myxococcota bacterium]